VDEKRLIEKLRSIEALFAGATTDGERVAAQEAKRRILERLKQLQSDEPPVEYRFKLADKWSRQLFLSLLRRYDIAPYRYPRQRATTVMARIPKRFVDETLWPQFEQLSETLRSHLNEVTQRVVAEVLHQDTSEASEVPEGQLPVFSDPAKK
jgi:hypothetical protein